jgi:riboflavin kinase/FMN adenylyltransferase
VPISRDTFLAVGVFDGVHRGHQSLIARLKAEAAKRGLSAGVFTFRNHPLTVLQPDVKLGYITGPETRRELLCSQGLDMVTMIEFTPEVARITAREFVSTLQERLGMKGLVVGPDFALGRNREGNVETLRKLGDEMGFEVVELAAKTEDDETIISSSAVRAAIMKGDIERANGLLGRPFTLEGEVMEGDRRGATLGFPTANLKPDPERIVPGNGIYATWTLVEGAGHPSATSIGVRPTFDAGDRTIETHVIDFNGDLYGKQIALQFVKRLRDEIRFASVEELKTQMTKDLEQARRALSSRRQEVA